ncbi:TetR/AcrR family transcriptional regulator [Actinoallomurus spadix]|uniref:TetR/AcrR family transcriptional regulator n=1 Tax=Actinoallomurus spadix TaxID=79912 RepID=A0ABP3FWD8_9ACTN|nr:TetR/AcrR family transcriptional regulator [Actinoallomurus spadix]MCO5986114.1 TetR/AcrR family transcriptional regulator [Actinoallomurus spadix]
MPYRRTPRIEARLSASRERIRAAALAVVAERGYAGFSIAAVARRAGVATGSVYRHFPSKSELVAEVFRVASQREVDAFARAASPARTAAEDLAAVIGTFARRALRAPRIAYALLAEPVDPAVDAERLVFRRAYAAVLAGLISRGIATGELPEQDVEVSAAALVGAIGEALVGPLAVGAARPDDRERHAATDPPAGLIPNLISFAQRSIGAVSDNA